MSEIEKSPSADAANHVEPAGVETPSAATASTPDVAASTPSTPDVAVPSPATPWGDPPAAAPDAAAPVAEYAPTVEVPVAAAHYGATPDQAPAYTGQPESVPAYGGQPAAQAEPVSSAVPAYAGQTSAQSGQVPPAFAAPGYGGPGGPPPVVGGVPTTGPVWNPPPSGGAGKTAVKVIAVTVAAGLLSICSGITGAVIATQWDKQEPKSVVNGPKSTNAAPVLDRSSLSGVAASVQASVVSIQHGSGEGSGVVVTEDGYILTNNHVVANAQGELTVVLSNGKKVTAKVVGTDPRTDLAVVKADATGLTPASFGDSNAMKVGDTVLAIGSPLGLKGSVTMGIVSAKGRTIAPGGGQSLSGLLQTDAPINPGNSGGALINLKGEVIGINTAIATGGTEGGGNIGVGFAIPSDKAKAVADALIKGQKVSHAYLGVSVTPAKTGGATIGGLTAGSPAVKAGLQTGDVITKFDDKVINDSDDLVSAVQSGTVGQQVTIEYIRNGETKTTTVTLGEAS